MMLLNPGEVRKILKQPEDTSTAPAGELKGRFKRLSLYFVGKGKQLKKPLSKDHKNSEDNPTRQSFSSLFSRKPPRSEIASPAEKPLQPEENDWTLV